MQRAISLRKELMLNHGFLEQPEREKATLQPANYCSWTWLLQLSHAYGGNARETERFLTELALKLSEKKQIDRSIVIYWMRVKLSFNY